MKKTKQMLHYTSEIQVRYKVNPHLKRIVKTWTPQEDEKLIQLHTKYPKKWGKISEMIKNRNQNQCLHRYRRIIKVGQPKKIWSTRQDQIVKEMFQQYGNNWKAIANILGTKSGKQIRQRFINNLDPKINKQEWTQSEDLKIIEQYSKFGSKWSQISKCFEGRPENRIKNRFYSYIQKNYDISIKDQDKSDKIGQVLCNSHSQQMDEQEKQPSLIFIHKSLPQQSKQTILRENKQNDRQIDKQNDRQMIKQNDRQMIKQNDRQMDKQNQLKSSILQRQFQKTIQSKICLDEIWVRQKISQEVDLKDRSLQQINQHTQNVYGSKQNHQDFFYFQDD